MAQPEDVTGSAGDRSSAPASCLMTACDVTTLRIVRCRGLTIVMVIVIMVIAGLNPSSQGNGYSYR